MHPDNFDMESWLRRSARVRQASSRVKIDIHQLPILCRVKLASYVLVTHNY